MYLLSRGNANFMHAFVECFDDDPNTIYHLDLALTLLNSVMKVALRKMSDISLSFQSEEKHGLLLT